MGFENVTLVKNESYSNAYVFSNMSLPEFSFTHREQKKKDLLSWIEKHPEETEIIKEIIQENRFHTQEFDQNNTQETIVNMNVIKKCLEKKYEEAFRMNPKNHTLALETLRPLLAIQKQYIEILKKDTNTDKTTLSNELTGFQGIQENILYHTKHTKIHEYDDIIEMELSNKQRFVKGFLHNFDRGQHSYITYDPRQSNEYRQTTYGRGVRIQSLEAAIDLGCGIARHILHDIDNSTIQLSSDTFVPKEWNNHFNVGRLPFLPTCPICSNPCLMRFHSKELRYVLCEGNRAGEGEGERKEEGDEKTYHYMWDPRANRHTTHGIEWDPYERNTN